MNGKNSDDVKKRIAQYLTTSSKAELQRKCDFNFDLESYFAHKDNDTSSGSYLYVRVSCEEPHLSCEVLVPVFEDVKDMKEYFELNKNQLEKSALNLVIVGRCITESIKDDNI